MNYLSEKIVVNEMRLEYKEWCSLLSVEEYKAIRKYSYNSYDKKPNRFFERINTMLRGTYNRSDSTKLKVYANVISKAICRHNLQQPIICYRGSDIDVTSGIETNTEFMFNQFISTSVIKSKVFKCRYLYIIYAVPGTKGAYIEEISCSPKQREFLLDKNCKYKLLSRKENIIELEVVL